MLSNPFIAEGKSKFELKFKKAKEIVRKTKIL